MSGKSSADGTSLAAKDDYCFVCRTGGNVICCDVPNCSKVYHRGCLKPGQAPEANAGNSLRSKAMKKVAKIYNSGHMGHQFSAKIEAHEIEHYNRVKDAALDRLFDSNDTESEDKQWRCPWHYCDECGQTATKGCAKCPVSYCHQHGNTVGELVPFACLSEGRRLERVHTFNEVRVWTMQTAKSSTS